MIAETQKSLASLLKRIYPRVYLRGYRIARLEETRLGTFDLDAESAEHLGRNNIGVFVGNCGGLGRAIDHLKNIDRADDGGLWVVICATQKMNAVLYADWQLDRTSFVSPRRVPTYWATSRLLFSTPEGLPKVDKSALARIIHLDLRSVEGEG